MTWGEQVCSRQQRAEDSKRMHLGTKVTMVSSNMGVLRSKDIFSVLMLNEDVYQKVKQSAILLEPQCPHPVTSRYILTSILWHVKPNYTLYFPHCCYLLNQFIVPIILQSDSCKLELYCNSSKVSPSFYTGHHHSLNNHKCKTRHPPQHLT